MPPFDTPENAEYEAARAKEARDKPTLADVHVKADVSISEFERIADAVVSRNLEIDEIDEIVSALPSSETRILENGLYPFSETQSPSLGN